MKACFDAGADGGLEVMRPGEEAGIDAFQNLKPTEAAPLSRRRTANPQPAKNAALPRKMLGAG